MKKVGERKSGMLILGDVVDTIDKSTRVVYAKGEKPIY